VGGVVLALAVVEAGYDDGAVDVAVKEINQDFLADSWQLDAAPVVPCGGG
jgi:Cys-tRNA synthase (O-phospho-L-seryl-tRNA:Cys-tRNA synthase)